MASEHSNSSPFYRVSYKKKPAGTRSVSSISQWMRKKVDFKQAIPGKVRAQYYIQGAIREEFEQIINKFEAIPTINEVSDQEVEDLRKILDMPGTTPDQVIKELQRTLADRDKTIHRLETEINALQESLPELKNQLSQKTRPSSTTDCGTAVEWQEVLAGFQIYRNIFQTGMDNPKTQDGLYAALDAVCSRFGFTDKGARDKMDVALAIATKYAGTKE